MPTTAPTPSPGEPSPEPFDFKATTDRLLLLTQAFLGAQDFDELKDLVRISGAADSLGPIFHPTEWMKSSGRHKDVAELASRVRTLAGWFKEKFPEAGL